jgi:microcystin-dependent protein
MAYPPTPPPADRLNTTPQVTNHPADHNLISDNVSDIVNELGANPSGTFADVQARLDSIMPIGTILEYGSETPPIGNWELCHGASKSTTGTYAALFAVIGYEFGGAGSAFNIPDFRNRSAVGLNSAGEGIGIAAGNATSELLEHHHSMRAHVHDGTSHFHSGTTLTAVSKNVPHAHIPGEGGNFVTRNGGTVLTNGATGGGTTELRVQNVTSEANVTHGHTISGNTGDAEGGDTTGPPDIPDTDDVGLANASNYHPYLRVSKIIKY